MLTRETYFYFTLFCSLKCGKMSAFHELSNTCRNKIMSVLSENLCKAVVVLYGRVSMFINAYLEKLVCEKANDS